VTAGQLLQVNGIRDREYSCIKKLGKLTLGLWPQPCGRGRRTQAAALVLLPWPKPAVAGALGAARASVPSHR
jgi:hypothetical protein